MSGVQFIVLVAIVFVVWAVKECVVSYMEQKTAKLRIERDHVTATKYWELIHQEQLKQKAFNDQLTKLLQQDNRSAAQQAPLRKTQIAFVATYAPEGMTNEDVELLVRKVEEAHGIK